MIKKSQELNKQLLDKSFRHNLRDDPKKVIEDINNYDNNNVSIKVVTNTKDKIYLVFPDKSLPQDWDNISAGVKASTAGSVGSVGSISTAGSASTIGSLSSTIGTADTLSSASSAGTVGSAGTVQVSY